MTIELWNAVIVGVALAIVLLIIAASARRVPALSVGVGVWFVIAVALAQRGFFQNAQSFTEGDLVGFGVFGTLMSLPVVIFIIGYLRSERLRLWIADIPAPLLVGFQVYRVVGVVFLWLLAEGLVPRELGIPTGIADLMVGVLALPLAWGLWRGMRFSQMLTIGWSIFGIADFVAAISVVSVAILGWVNLQPDPALIGMYPLAIISLVQVPLSIVLHGLVLMRLLRPSSHVAGTLSMSAV